MENLLHKFLNTIKNKTVIICGLGLSNEYIIKVMFEFGINIIVYDSKIESKINPKIAEYVRLNNIYYRFGTGYIGDLDFDIMIRTPGLSYLSPIVSNAREKGVVITSEMEIFFDLCPCKIIGITGSDGKTTVTTIISEILRNSGKKVFTGGNIGTPLLPRLNEINEKNIVVAELSSFQLISMRRSPDVAIVTNMSPNHLDVHRDMQEYIDAKKNIVLHQNAFGLAVLNYDNKIAQQMSSQIRGKALYFSRKQKMQQGSWVTPDKKIMFSQKGEDTFVMNSSDIKIAGNHNLENYLAAINAVWGYANVESIRKVAREFSGVEHRMELVRSLDGVSYYNDSIATTPARVISGCLSLFEKKIILICGGYDKNIPFTQLGDIVAQKVKTLILLGNTAKKIEEVVRSSSYYSDIGPIIIRVSSMEDAVNQVVANSLFGDIVVLSPACASFDMYKNFEDRGNHFKKLVLSLRGNEVGRIT